MIELIYSPKWFYGKDILIDIISIIVLFSIAFFSIKYYQINKTKKNYLYLALSFILLAISFICKIATNFTVYYHVLETRQIGFVSFTYQTMRSTDTLFFFGFLLYRICTLMGFYILYSIYQKQPSSNIFIILYMILVMTYFSQSAYFIFHITSLILLLFITHTYYRNNQKVKHYTSKLTFLSFALITLSHLISIFVKVNLLFYVIAELIQLCGYIMLLFAFIMVLRYAKKKK
jgi:hypothetical protein